jgi:hypothetical protein
MPRNPFGDLFARNEGLDPLDAVLARPRVTYDPGSLSGRVLSRSIQVSQGGPSLRPAQVSALLAAVDAFSSDQNATEGPRGIVAMLGCGHGKTLVGQLLPSIFHARTPLVLMPSALRTQWIRELRDWSYRFRLPDLSDKTGSYEMLSSAGKADALFEYAPDLVVLDEAHLLSNRDSARWRRLESFLEVRQHDCRVCVLSGTLTVRSLHDMAHLLYAALRDWSPLPADSSLETWANCLDLGGEPSAAETIYMLKLAKWADQPGTRSGLRNAFRERLQTSRGVVLTRSTSADVSLRIRLWDGPPQPDSIKTALAGVSTAWTLPDGAELVDGLEVHRAYRQLACGYWTRWVEGTGNPAWFLCRRTWGAMVRSRILYGSFDSPSAVAEAAQAGRLTERERGAYLDWTTIQADEPDHETVWLDGGPEYLHAIPEAYFAAYGRTDAIFWFASRALGRVLSDSMGYHGQGSLPPHGGSAAVSMWVHGKGWNGQIYHRNVILEPLVSAGAWEQLLARTHRPGQVLDVDTTVLVNSSHARACFFRALEGARFIEETTGEPQRLLYADKEY